MSFEHDAFISYAHIDNQPLLTEQDGWVTVFHKALRQVLSRCTGKEASVWRDVKLHGNEVFSEKILSQFPATAVLVSVLSPRYLKSTECIKEILGFYDEAEKTGGVLVGDKCRIFKIIKTPFGNETLPDKVAAVLRRELGYDFYRLTEDDTPQELDPAFGDPMRQEFLKSVTRVAWHIKYLLDAIDGPPNRKPAIYLAECARDRRDARMEIEEELKRLGYPVLPDRQLPSDATEYVEEVEQQLSRCVLSIHLIGSGYGAVPDGTYESVVLLQNESAVRVSRATGLKRVISVPAETQATDGRQQAFISALHRDAAMQFGADLITGGIDDLKSVVIAALESLELRNQPAVIEPTEPLVYIICDPRDMETTVPLARRLITRGARVELPVFAGDAKTVREANEQLMMDADGIVLFYGAGDDRWHTHQRSDITKARGARPKNPPHTQSYVASPATTKKQFLLDTEPDAINGLDAFSAATLEPFIEALGLQ
jgi:hypothetical protein